MENYLDQDLADLGVVGGEIRVVATNGTARLKVVFWLPGSATDELVERLRADTVAQLDDGVGEGGFQFNADGTKLLVAAATKEPVDVEAVDDERVTRLPSRIAIAARDGDLASLAVAIKDDAGGIDRLHQGYSGLHLAILNGYGEAVRMLLAAGAGFESARPTRVDTFGAVALSIRLTTSTVVIWRRYCSLPALSQAT